MGFNRQLKIIISAIRITCIENMILEFRSCPERYDYLCISNESSEEHPADVFSDAGVEDDDSDLKH